MLVRTVHGYRRLFGVPDEIPDVTRVSGMVRGRRLIYRMKGFGVRKCSGEYREIGGIPERGFGGSGSSSGPNGPQGGTPQPSGGCAPPLGPLLMRLRGWDPLGQPHPFGVGGKAPRGGNPRAWPWPPPPPALAAAPPCPGRRPPRGETLGRPPLSTPLYIVRQREGSKHKFVPRCCPPSPTTSSSPAVLRRSSAGILLHHHHHAVVLPVLHQPLLHPLLDQEGGDVPEPYV